MISIEGTEIEYPNAYNFDLKPVRGKHLVLEHGYKRHSKSAKYVVSLKWNNLTETQKDIIMGFYNSQFQSFQTLTFLFQQARINEDLGPIEVFMKLEGIKPKINDYYELSFTLIEK
jgi:hypothetical protein